MTILEPPGRCGRLWRRRDVRGVGAGWPGRRATRSWLANASGRTRSRVQLRLQVATVPPACTRASPVARGGARTATKRPPPTAARASPRPRHCVPSVALRLPPRVSEPAACSAAARAEPSLLFERVVEEDEDGAHHQQHRDGAHAVQHAVPVAVHYKETVSKRATKRATKSAQPQPKPSPAAMHVCAGDGMALVAAFTLASTASTAHRAAVLPATYAPLTPPSPAACRSCSAASRPCAGRRP